jgi:hypothetical protein
MEPKPDITSIQGEREERLYLLGLIHEDRLFCIHGLLDDSFCPYHNDTYLLYNSLCPPSFDFLLMSPFVSVRPAEFETKKSLHVKNSRTRISESLWAHSNGPWINGPRSALPFYIAFSDDKKGIVYRETLKDLLQPCLINNVGSPPSVLLPLTEKEDECDRFIENEYWWFSLRRLKKFFKLVETMEPGLDIIGRWFE